MNEKEFALRLARLRERKGVSARDMSLSIGQNPGYINNIESGKSMPSLMGLFYICEYLGITLAEFFDTEVAAPERLSCVMQDLRRLNERQLEAVAAVVHELVRGQ